ncbi:hypothetical protein TNCV_3008081 [Trichonephila clavipes]|nr:hypothetical protein TNCV_3008081 [Trichonephila clavipes]
MPTLAAVASCALDYAVEDPWREQLDRDGRTDARLGNFHDRQRSGEVAGQERKDGKLILVLFEPRTYTGSCMAPRVVLLEDAIILRKNNAHVGVPNMVRKDRFVGLYGSIVPSTMI